MVLMDNIRNVARLETHPTHQLRVTNNASCIPEIHHESRMFTSMVRMLSGDSRATILSAIERTLELTADQVQQNTAFRDRVVPYNAPFEKGVRILQTFYERDMSVLTIIDRILQRWGTLIDACMEKKEAEL